MTFNNFNQPQAPQAPQAPQPQAYEKKDRKVFTGKITKDLVLRQTQTGKSVVNIDFVMDIKSLETGSQFAKIALWEFEAEVAAHIFKKGDNIIGSGIVTFDEWLGNDGQINKSLEYKDATIALGMEQVISLIRNEINMFAQTLQPQAPQQQVQPQVPQQQVQPQAPQQQVPQQPTQVVDTKEEFGGPTLDISSDDLPF